MRSEIGKTMLSLSAIVWLLCTGCTKQVAEPGHEPTMGSTAQAKLIIYKRPGPLDFLKDFRRYHIAAGGHSAVPNPVVLTARAELKFRVYFDSSCVYLTQNPKNQIDINKLLGFADNNSFHQLHSARFGWRWLNPGLELLGYVYNNGVRSFAPIARVSIGAVHHCSIRVAGGSYIFSVNDAEAVSLPRSSRTATGSGYMLYPYFGGDEVAPKPINIWIQQF
jgi:hypothetical protein